MMISSPPDVASTSFENSVLASSMLIVCMSAPDIPVNIVTRDRLAKAVGRRPLPSFECAFGHAVPGVSTSRRPVPRYQEETSGARCCRQLNAIAGALLKTHSRGDLKTKLGQLVAKGPQRTPSAYIDSRHWLVRYAVAFSQLFRMSLAQAPPRFT
jgi:hypothetical protein